MVEFDHDPESYYKEKSRYLAALNVPAYDDSIECRRDYAAVDKIMHNWQRLAMRISVEMVQCRRRRKLTDEYNRLIRDYRACQQELEQAITMYQLMHG